ncbi:ParA family protein [Staphylococcus aureus]|uniref:ParA family protein n=1 Tax=Staphylococcus aureus TaxID=1280 RepID=UPI00025F4BA3|nr:ParA family protein [Staphylococcus aureus]EHK9432928.1 ParA family protein [Enterococcus faecalis]MCZ1551690.1 ParA family protein [Enterococcus faecium]EIK28175.1 hypothetical protein MQU_02719 [Staphylococcus aureus subsp. aureus VRS11a]EIK28700.1 hypothetical protein MQW_02722 [Staphylococcus aureus subsp. aureus VRS11b]EKK5893842.1 ParA family protein [Enterococcus faecalis]
MSKDIWKFEERYHEILTLIKQRSTALVLTVNNYKGGVGKSTLIVLFAYIFSKLKIKILLVDSDPQRTLTKKIQKNFPVIEQSKYTFMEGIKRNTLEQSITKLGEYIYIVEGDWELSTLDRYSRENLKIEAEYYLYSFLIDSLKAKFDLIIFDAVPTTSIFTHNCIVASDYVLAPTQAEEESYDNTISYMNYLNSMKNYNQSLDILGVVPYLSELDNATNIKYLKKYQHTFGKLTFQNIIKRSARVMSWGTDGITETKGYDKQTLSMYINVFKEFLERLELVELEEHNG